MFPLAMATRAYHAESLVILAIEVSSLVLLTTFIAPPLYSVSRILERLS